MAISILLADDHLLVRQGLRKLLESELDLLVVGETGDGLQVADLAESLRPDVLVLDLMLPGLGGLEVAHRVRRQAPATQVVVLSMYSDTAYVAEALAGGACAYVLKKATAAELVMAIRSAAAGRTYLDSSLSSETIARHRNRAHTITDPYARLTRREREVLHLVADGLTSAEIAIRLAISPRTVDMHRRHLVRKLDLSGQAALVRYAVQRRLVTPS
jgi:DNA-binding NarL/FixJ family response regulator